MQKFPYPGYTEKELSHMEDKYWCLAMGSDFVMSGDLCTFTQKEIVKLYNQTLNRLINLSIDGTAKDKKYVIELIGTLRITPFRLH